MDLNSIVICRWKAISLQPIRNSKRVRSVLCLDDNDDEEEEYEDASDDEEGEEEGEGQREKIEGSD